MNDKINHQFVRS